MNQNDTPDTGHGEQAAPGQGPGQASGQGPDQAPGQASDPAAEAILTLVAALPAGKSLTPEAVARAIAQERAKPSDPPDAWRRYLNPVKQQALNLARRGRIAILRKGKPVDPRVPVKGVIRLAAAPVED